MHAFLDRLIIHQTACTSWVRNYISTCILPYIGYISHDLNFRILTSYPKIKTAKRNRLYMVVLHVVVYSKSLTVEYLIHVSFHDLKYTRYTVCDIIMIVMPLIMVAALESL